MYRAVDAGMYHEEKYHVESCREGKYHEAVNHAEGNRWAMNHVWPKPLPLH